MLPAREREAALRARTRCWSGVGGLVAAEDGGGNSIAGPETAKLLRKAGERKEVKGVVLRVSSPGGSVVGSDEIWREVSALKDEKEIPVVISMGDVAASGGYYISAPASRILAMPGTITGSIGVIMVCSFDLLPFSSAGPAADTALPSLLYFRRES